MRFSLFDLFISKKEQGFAIGTLLFWGEDETYESSSLLSIVRFAEDNSIYVSILFHGFLFEEGE